MHCISHIQRGEHRQTRGQFGPLKDEWNDGPRSCFQAVALSQKIGELIEGVDEVGRREDKQRASTLLDSTLELNNSWHAKDEGCFREVMYAGLAQRIEQISFDVPDRLSAASCPP